MSLERRDPAIAALLSALWMGAGNIYNGNVTKGIILAVFCIVIMIMAATLILFPVALGLWIWGIVDAYREAKYTNEMSIRNDKDAVDAANLAESKRLSETISCERFRHAVSKVYKIFKAGVISEVEYRQRIRQVILDLVTKKLSEGEDADDFLYEVAKLKELGALSEDDVQAIKASII